MIGRQLPCCGLLWGLMCPNSRTVRSCHIMLQDSRSPTTVPCCEELKIDSKRVTETPHKQNYQMCYSRQSRLVLL